MSKAQYYKIHLDKGVCVLRPPGKGSRMPSITNPKDDPPQKESNIDEDKLIKLAKTMAKEMAIEMSKHIQTTTVVQQVAGVEQQLKDDIIDIESSFIDPSESEDFSVNLDNVETKAGDNIQDKLAKLKKLTKNK